MLGVVFTFNLKDNTRTMVEAARLVGWRSQIDSMPFIALNVILVIGCFALALLLWRRSRPPSVPAETPSRFP